MKFVIYIYYHVSFRSFTAKEILAQIGSSEKSETNYISENNAPPKVYRKSKNHIKEKEVNGNQTFRSRLIII